jgi:hypothetical protein
MRTIRRRAAAGLVALAVALSLAACSSSSPTASSGGSAATTTSPPTGSATPSAPTTSSATTLVPMQTANGGEFLSPTGNISCEINYNRDGLTGAYCQTTTPPQSVHMDATGSYTTCSGEQCLGNAGINTPTLAYGTATGVGPFVCESDTAGVTCNAGGRGFRISRSGITPV